MGISHLQLFNGRNPHSVHHIDDAVRATDDIGAIVHFLPPYSPDLSPIEELFSKVKYNMKSFEGVMQETNVFFLNVFAMITEDDCKNWVYDSKINSRR